MSTPNYLNSLTIVSPDAEVLRAFFARLGFSLLPGGVIALQSAVLVLRDAAEPPHALAPFAVEMSDRPKPMPAAPAPHPNGARGLAALAKVFENPAEQAESLSRATNQREIRATSLGIELRLANARLEALTSTAFAQVYGETDAEPPQALVFAANLAAARSYFRRQGLDYTEKFGRLVLKDAPAGLILAFEAKEER